MRRLTLIGTLTLLVSFFGTVEVMTAVFGRNYAMAEVDRTGLIPETITADEVKGSDNE